MSDLETFISQIERYRDDRVFNPFGETCGKNDCEGAAEWRLDNLRAQLEIAQTARVTDLWIGRDLGYLGGRRTGIALSDEYHLQDFRSSWGLKFQQVTNGPPCKEKTATFIWRILKELNQPVLTWNVFPFHPHFADRPFTNRPHTAKERDKGLCLLSDLLGLVKPNRIVAIGRHAQHAVRKIEHDSIIIEARHPSYGGQGDFFKTVMGAYNITALSEQRSLL